LPKLTPNARATRTTSPSDGTVRTAGAIYGEGTCGIAPPTGSPLRKPINEALLKLMQDGVYEEIYNKWFRADTP